MTRRRPLSRARVLPVPIARRSMEATSPRALLMPPSSLAASLKLTSPAWGMARNRSSPSVAAMASISSSPSTVTGSASLMRTEAMRDPTTTTSATWAASAVWPVRRRRTITSPSRPAISRSESAMTRMIAASTSMLPCTEGAVRRSRWPVGAEICTPA
ncbi:hypothetical protein D3C77_428540 [compost metagenome]